MDTTFIMALGKLRLNNTDETLEKFITIALRQRQALNFYAASENYIDHAPQIIDHDGLFAHDDGAVARYALGEDYVN